MLYGQKEFRADVNSQFMCLKVDTAASTQKPAEALSRPQGGGLPETGVDAGMEEVAPGCTVPSLPAPVEAVSAANMDARLQVCEPLSCLQKPPASGHAVDYVI